MTTETSSCTPELIKAQKRNCITVSVEAAAAEIVTENEEVTLPETKRFKSLYADKVERNLLHGLQGGAGNSMLSPITEISNHLSDTKLTAETVGHAAKTDTPKLCLKAEPNRKLRMMLNETSEPKSAVDIKSENSLVHLTHIEPALQAIVGNDALSLYAEELDLGSEGSSGLTPSSPSAMMGLLSPDGSPIRFQIVSRKRSQLPQNRMATNGSQLHSFHSLSSCSMDSSSVDDEYMELIEMESLEPMPSHDLFEFPAGLNSLISGQIVAAQQANSPMRANFLQRPAARRCLSLSTESQLQLQQSPKSPERLRSKNTNETSISANTPVTFKRPEPPSQNASPIQYKRLRGICQDKENLDDSFTRLRQNRSPADKQSKATTAFPNLARPAFRKSMSMNDAEIMSALSRCDNANEPELIGDFSKPFALPLMEGRHRDLKSISSETVARLIRGEFKKEVESFKIIDCRYPYEYEGGHIRGALNLYTQEQIIEEFLTQQKTDKQELDAAAVAPKRNIIIFHCEFSSERGPKLSRFLRSHDRERNTNSYPSLDYPEIYLLHNGYKEFYQTHKELCDPISYRPMLEPSFSEEYRHFRAKSKSWNGDGCGGGTARHMKKSRSRLML